MIGAPAHVFERPLQLTQRIIAAGSMLGVLLTGAACESNTERPSDTKDLVAPSGKLFTRGDIAACEPNAKKRVAIAITSLGLPGQLPLLLSRDPATWKKVNDRAMDRIDKDIFSEGFRLSTNVYYFGGDKADAQRKSDELLATAVDMLHIPSGSIEEDTPVSQALETHTPSQAGTPAVVAARLARCIA